ncbi:hypothetical protein BO71DRAFT_279679, partial [Aspergillus ellipticus CBS 707.79]
ILSSLSETPYACGSLTRLSGGNVNFIYRGTLTKPFENGCSSVILKHSEERAAHVPDLDIPLIRCIAEQAVLKTLTTQCSGMIPLSGAKIRTPQLYHFDTQSYTSVMEDFVDTMTLNCVLGAHEKLDSDSGATLGNAVGGWLRAFHENMQPDLDMAIIGEYSKLLRVRSVVWYFRNFTNTAQRLLDLPEHDKIILKEYTRKFVVEELLRRDDRGWGIINADFSTRNILVSKSQTSEGQNPDLGIVDWESCQYGSHMQDLGRIIADLHIIHALIDNELCISMAQAIFKGYGEVNEAESFRLAVYIGGFLLNMETLVENFDKIDNERKKALAVCARDIFVKACEKDRKWFETSILAYLFTG